MLFFEPTKSLRKLLVCKVLNLDHNKYSLTVIYITKILVERDEKGWMGIWGWGLRFEKSADL